MKKFLILAFLAALILSVSACGCGKILTEEEKFINASAEMACEAVKDPSLTLDLIKSKELSAKIFGEYDFPIEDNEAMLGIMDKYEKSEEVTKKIAAKVEEECK